MLLRVFPTAIRAILSTPGQFAPPVVDRHKQCPAVSLHSVLAGAQAAASGMPNHVICDGSKSVTGSQ